MIVHIVLNDSFPYGGALTSRIMHYAKGIKENGGECKIIIPIPHDKYNKVMNKKTKGAYESTEFCYTARTAYRHRNFFVRRFNDFIGYAGTLLYLMRKTKKNDVVICTSPSTLHYTLILFICRICSLKTVSEMNELPFVYGEQTDAIIKKRNRFFKGIFKKFDAHIVISDTLYEISKEHTNAPILKVPIIIDPEIANSIKDETNPESVPFIFHSGTLTERKDGICGMLEAFGIAKKGMAKNIMFISTGYLEKSPDKEKIDKIIDKYNLRESVKFMGYLDNETLRRYQKYCSAVIINKYPTLQNKFCFATKTGEFLIFKRPIIMTKVGEAMNFLKDNDNAYIIEPNDPTLIAEKIVHIFNNKAEAERIGSNGYKLAEKEFNFRYQTKQMLDFFNKLSN